MSNFKSSALVVSNKATSVTPTISGDLAIVARNDHLQVFNGLVEQQIPYYSEIVATSGDLKTLVNNEAIARANADLLLTPLTTTADISGGLNGRLVTVEGNYATKASPSAGTYNSVVVNTQGIVTSGGNVTYTIPSDLSVYTLLTTTQGVSATLNTSITNEANTRYSGDQSLQSEINNISGGSFVLDTRYAKTTDISVISGGLNTSITNETIFRVAGDSALQTEVNNITGGNFVLDTRYSKTSDIVVISGGLNSRLTTVENNYATKATPIAGTYNNVIVNSQGIVTSGGNINLSGTYVPYTGATLNVNLGTKTLTADAISFNQTPVTSVAPGQISWNSIDKTFDLGLTSQVTLQVGEESLTRVHNGTSSPISSGQTIYFVGMLNDRPIAALASSATDSMSKVEGVATENIAVSGDGFITMRGVVHDLDTSNYTSGQTVYLGEIPGTFTTQISGFALSSHLNRIGYIGTISPISGSLLVSITNESTVVSLSDNEKNILAGNNTSTGVYDYSGMTIATSASFTIPPLKGFIVNNTIPYSVAPIITNLIFPGGTYPVTNISTTDITYVLINSSGTTFQQSTIPTPQQIRENLYIGKLFHAGRTSINAIINDAAYDNSPLSALRDMFEPIRLINNGITTYPNGSNLNFNTTAGSLVGMGINYSINPKDPNNTSISGAIPRSFSYRTKTGGPINVITNIDPNSYDLNGVITSIPTVGDGSANRSTNQRIYLFPNNFVEIQYGQQYYSSLANALAGQQTETFIKEPSIRDGAILIGLLAVRRSTTDLSLPARAIFTPASMFGESVGGVNGISTTTLQQAYDNSIQPEIITNSILDGVTIQIGSNQANSAAALQINNNLGVVVSKFDGLGNITSSAISGNANNLVTHDINGKLIDAGVSVSNLTLLSTTASISGNLQGQITINSGLITTNSGLITGLQTQINNITGGSFVLDSRYSKTSDIVTISGGLNTSINNEATIRYNADVALQSEINNISGGSFVLDSRYATKASPTAGTYNNVIVNTSGIVTSGGNINYALDSGVVHTTGNENISGNKTFNTAVTVNTGGMLFNDTTLTTISTTAEELVLTQNGAFYGPTSLILTNVFGANGALFSNSGLDLVDFGFLPNSGIQSNIRLEHRAGYVLPSNTNGEFQLLFDSLNNSLTSVKLGDGECLFNTPVTVNTLYSNNLVGVFGNIVVHDTNGQLFDGGVSFTSLATKASPISGTYNSVIVNSQGIVTSGGNISYSGVVDLSAYTLLTTTQGVSATLNSSINNEATIRYNADVSLQSEINNITGGNFVLDSRYSKTSDIVVISGGLNSRLTTVESNYATKATPIAGTYNNVIVNSQGIVTSGGNVTYSATVDLSGYTLLSTTQGVSATLNTSINNEATTRYNSDVALQSEINNITGGSFVLDTRYSKTSDIVTVSGGLNSRLTTVEGNYATKATPNAGTYNNVVVNTQGIITSGGNIVYALDSGVVHLAGTETITGLKTFNNTISSASYYSSLMNGTISNLFTVQQEPTGFENRTDSTMSFTNSDRTFRITGTYNIYIKGVKYTKTGETQQITNTIGIHFVYYNSSGVFTYSAGTPWSILASDVMIATIFWDGTQGILVEERHGLTMDQVTHYYLHNVNGTQRISGFGISGYTPQGNTDATNSYAVASGILADEDLIYTTSSLADGGPYNLAYRTGVNGDWTWTTSSSIPYHNTSNNIQYNQNTGSTWQLTQITNSSTYVNYYVIASTAISGSQSFFIVPGQATHNSLNNAQAESFDNLSKGVFPFIEFNAVYQITYRYNTGYGTTGRARTEATPVLLSLSNVNAAAAGTHNSLGGLQGGAAGEYYHLTASQNSDFIGKTEVTSVSGGLNTLINNEVTNLYNYDVLLQSEINNISGGSFVLDSRYSKTSDIVTISGGLNSRLTTVENNYATKATPNVGTYNSVVVNSQGIVTSGGNIGYALDSGVVHTTGNENISGNKTFNNRLITTASTTGSAGINIPSGVAPTSPTNGDVWTTNSAVYARLNGVTRNMNMVVSSLTDASTIAVDASIGDEVEVTLASSRIMGAPTNPRHGQLLLFKIKQGGSGSNTITAWTSGAGGYQFTSTIPEPPLSTTVGHSDYIGFIYDSVSNHWNCLTWAIGYV